MDQWNPYSDSQSGPSRRYTGNPSQQQSQQSRDYNPNLQVQPPPPAGFTYDQYPGGPVSGHSQSMAPSPAVAPHARDGNGDTAMQDGDAYKYSYAIRGSQQHASGGRPAQPGQEPSAAAQRYSPMDTLSPNSPFVATPQHQYGAQARPSPTRAGSFPSPGYYGSRPPTQLPPITPYASNNEVYPGSATAQLNAVFGHDPKSPRRPMQQAVQGPPGRGPVPEFTKVRSLADLKPKVNSQPAFRRADPEGGFISVRLAQKISRASTNTLFQPLQALTSHLPSTYRICNPSFKYESSRNPRRVLTKPSKGVKNDGFDNEDSDYILYVNDILGSEETGHKYVSRLIYLVNTLVPILTISSGTDI